MPKNSIQRVTVAVGMLSMAICSLPSAARTDGAAAEACKALETTDFSGVEDAPTQVMEAKVVDALGEVPAHCHAQGYIAPQVGFELKLPTTAWNGRFIEIGKGGYAGSTRFKDLVEWCADALRRGYACVVSDHGHTSSKDGQGARAAIDGVWAYNNLQAEIDYGFRSVHVTALAGKAITQHYYGTAPKYSYFMGCSGAGRQALVAAQRFPWDFDGIVAMDPALNLCGAVMALHWNVLAATGQNGKSLFAPTDLELLSDAAIARCDGDDGLKDGVIGDPRTCRFDPAKLLCKTDQKSGCLSPVQVAAAQKIYGGPVTSKGEKIFAGGTMPGAEKGFLGFAIATQIPEFTPTFFRYMGFMPDAAPNWNPRDFDFDADYQRLGMMEMLYASNNPDLRQFKAAGGKLIISQGWDDSGSPLPLNTIDYYETVERAMGGRARTQEFARLFMMPGREHCGIRGPGVNAIDYLGYLEAWVEQDRAPDVMIGAQVESNNSADYIRLPKDPGRAKFTRPIYPYPLQYRYKGAGDPNDHRNFKSIDPAR